MDSQKDSRFSVDCFVQNVRKRLSPPLSHSETYETQNTKYVMRISGDNISYSSIDLVKKRRKKKDLMSLKQKNDTVQDVDCLTHFSPDTHAHTSLQPLLAVQN